MHIWRFHRYAHFRNRRSEGLLVSGRGHTATPRSRGGAPPTEVGRGGCLGGGEGWQRVRSEETRASEREREGRDRRRRQLLLLLLLRAAAAAAAALRGTPLHGHRWGRLGD